MLTPENAVAVLKKAASTAERQRAFRARMRADGLAEVRGVFARPEHHARIRAYAARLAKAKVLDSPKLDG
jgi:hypothetical protein